MSHRLWCFTFAAVRFSIHTLGYLLLLLVGTAVWWPQIVQQGMYNDGLWYAAIARNWSVGVGDWWHPQLSATFGAFVPHPPLVFWLEGSLFSLFGDQWWVERWYSLLVSFATVLAIRWLWRSTVSADNRDWWWVVVVLWAVNEVVYNYYPNNLLDSTMALAALLSVAFLLRKPRWSNTLAAMGFLVLALLAKGPVGLFPLAVPALRFCCFYEKNKPAYPIRETLVQTGMLLVGVLLTVGLLWLTSAGFRDFATAYYDIQIRGGLAGEQVYHARTSRFYILGKLTTLLLPVGLLTAAVWGIHTRHLTAPPHYRRVLLWGLIGLSASVPLALSPKQTYYYLLAAMPYFYLAAGTLLVPSLRALLPTRRQLVAGTVLLGAGMVVALLFTHDSHERIRGRHQTVLPDLQQLLPHLPPGSTVGSDEYGHTLLGYLARLRRVSVDTSRTARPLYYLTRQPASVPPGYEVLPLDTRAYRLYRKAE